jgi:ketosteroid isomerase-like protein
MRAKLLLIGTAILLLGADAKEDASKEVQKSLEVLNDAFAKQDEATIKKLMTEDHVAVTPYGGKQSRADQLKNLPELKITEYTASEARLTMLTKDSAMITYVLAQKGTYKGKDLPAKVYASSVWIKRDGKWQEALYQETTIPGK